MTGRHGTLRQQNERDAAEAAARDAAEKQALIDRQLISRRQLQRVLRQTRSTHLSEIALLQRDLAATVAMDAGETPQQQSEPELETIAVRRRRSPDPVLSGP